MKIIQVAFIAVAALASSSHAVQDEHLRGTKKTFDIEVAVAVGDDPPSHPQQKGVPKSADTLVDQVRPSLLHFLKSLVSFEVYSRTNYSGIFFSHCIINHYFNTD